jgi:dsRNA-specific ribonuclease
VSWPNLAQLGIATKLQQYIRPRAPIRPSQSRNILAQAKDEVKRLGEDPRRTIAFGIRAVIGAVYFDKNGGLDGAKRVMARLELIIKLPM